MTTHDTNDLKAEIKRHVVDDGALLIFGKYFDADTGAGCFIGCAAKSDDPNIVERKYGIPETVMRLGEAIYEGFGRNGQKTEAIDFFKKFGESIRDGIDLSRFHWRYLHETLSAIGPTGYANVDACLAESTEIAHLLAEGADVATLMARAARVALAEARSEAAAVARVARVALAEARSEAAAEEAGQINSWSAQAERFLRLMESGRNEKIQDLLNGDMGFVPAIFWKENKEPSKHDRCIHGQWAYDGCAECFETALCKILKE